MRTNHEEILVRRTFWKQIFQEIKAAKLLFHGKGVTSNPSTKINMIVGSNIVDDLIF